ncbi:MAG TPA: sigma-70 family RNA polymerase sigma factor [Solirubrobacterales bacterium]|nr:sigma-70 family RNA polymerase sigma factor [Solirubrobacterales bacterium]
MAQGQIEAGGLGQELAQVHFSRLYREQARAVLAYALRRVENRDDAADVVAETFLVAWRRLGEVPIGVEARLWLYAVARRVIANLHRTERRRTRLGQRLAESLRTEFATHAAPAGEAAEVLRAMAELSDGDRELLLLVSWEELSPGEAAKVLEISSLAARSRLHRARRRLSALLEDRQATGPLNPALDPEDAR